MRWEGVCAGRNEAKQNETGLERNRAGLNGREPIDRSPEMKTSKLYPENCGLYPAAFLAVF